MSLSTVRRHHIFTGSASAVGATTVDLATLDLSSFEGGYDDCQIHVEVVFQIYCTAGAALGAGGSARIAGAFLRVGGTLAAVSAALNIVAPQLSAALVAVGLVLDASGNVIRARLTGIAAHTVQGSAWVDAWIDDP